MEKFKICPICGKYNNPSMIECLECETDLTSVKVSDEQSEKLNEVADTNTNEKVRTQKYVRVCECGCVNLATAKTCTACGEDISDIAPVENELQEECLYVMTSLEGDFVYEIKEGEFVIGREHEMKDYLINRSYVSRQHAKIIKNSDGIFIENLNKTNYTFVNNKRIKEKTEIKFNDEIGLGGNATKGERQEEAAYFVLRNV